MVRLRHWLAAALPLFCLMNASCSRAPAPVLSSTIRSSLVASPLEQLKQTTIRLKVQDSAGRSVDLTHVVVSLTMSSMMMPPNLVNLHPIGKGEYSGVCTFTMEGTWTATATGSKSGKRLQIGVYFLSVRN